MKSTIYSICLLLLMGHAYAQNDNRGRAKTTYNPSNLSDAERRESETFMHEGRSQRVMMEECAGLSSAESELFQKNPQQAYKQFGDKLTKGMETCQGREEVKGLGLSPEMAAGVSKAYSMIIGMGGEAFGNLKMDDLDAIAKEKQAAADQAEAARVAENTNPAATTESVQQAQTNADVTKADAAEAQKTAEEEGEQDNTDYCKYVAIGTEVIAMLQQTMAQQEINNVPLEQERNPQRASLMRVARGYEERGKNAQTQTMGWGVTTGCYAAMMMRPGVDQGAWQNWLKLGASGFLTMVFNEQREGFKDAANKTKKVANMLPGAGDCNPHTDRDCYCSEPTTMNDPKYCAPYLHKRTIRDPGITMRTSCINNQAQADPQCKCLANDSCVHTGIDTLFKLDGVGGQINPAMMADLKGLSTGMVAGSLNSSAINRNLAAARTAMKKANDELSKLAPPKPTLSSSEELEAVQFEKFGVPKTLAKALASSPIAGGDATKTLAAIQSRFAPTSGAQKRNFDASVRDNASSGGLRPKKQSKKQVADNPFAKFMKPGQGKKAPNGQILNLAQRAEAQAQISNRKDSSVFDIISRRYQVSAWRRLELDQDL